MASWQIATDLVTATIVYQALISVLACGLISNQLVARQAGTLMASWQISTDLVTATIVLSTLIMVHTGRLISTSMVARVTTKIRTD